MWCAILRDNPKAIRTKKNKIQLMQTNHYYYLQ